MKKIFKKINEKGNNIFEKIKKTLLKRTIMDPRLAKWIDFYYPVGGGCFYILGGKVMRRRRRSNNLNQSINVRTRLSKELTDILIPVQVNHFLIID